MTDTDTIPAHTLAIWDDKCNLLNEDAAPLWSGKGPVPAIGDIVPVGKGMTVRITGYKIDGPWLMLLGERSDGRRGDLAGPEINWKRMATLEGNL